MVSGKWRSDRWKSIDTPHISHSLIVASFNSENSLSNNHKDTIMKNFRALRSIFTETLRIQTDDMPQHKAFPVYWHKMNGTMGNSIIIQTLAGAIVCGDTIDAILKLMDPSIRHIFSNYKASPSNLSQHKSLFDTSGINWAGYVPWKSVGISIKRQKLTQSLSDPMADGKALRGRFVFNISINVDAIIRPASQSSHLSLLKSILKQSDEPQTSHGYQMRKSSIVLPSDNNLSHDTGSSEETEEGHKNTCRNSTVDNEIVEKQSSYAKKHDLLIGRELIDTRSVLLLPFNTPRAGYDLIYLHLGM